MSNFRVDRKRSGLPRISEAQPTLEAILGLGLAGQKIDLHVGELVEVLIRRVGGVSELLVPPRHAPWSGSNPGRRRPKVDIPTVVLFAFRTVRTQLPSIVIGPGRPGVRNSQAVRVVSIALSPFGFWFSLLSFGPSLMCCPSPPLSSGRIQGVIQI